MAKHDFGEFAPDGAIRRDVEHSVLSGRPTQPGDVLTRIPGTPHFYRLTAAEKHKLTDEQRADIHKQYLSAYPPVDEPQAASSAASAKSGKSASASQATKGE